MFLGMIVIGKGDERTLDDQLDNNSTERDADGDEIGEEDSMFRDSLPDSIQNRYVRPGQKEKQGVAGVNYSTPNKDKGGMSKDRMEDDLSMNREDSISPRNPLSQQKFNKYKVDTEERIMEALDSIESYHDFEEQKTQEKQPSKFFSMKMNEAAESSSQADSFETISVETLVSEWFSVTVDDREGADNKHHSNSSLDTHRLEKGAEEADELLNLKIRTKKSPEENENNQVLDLDPWEDLDVGDEKHVSVGGLGLMNQIREVDTLGDQSKDTISAEIDQIPDEKVPINLGILNMLNMKTESNSDENRDEINIARYKNELAFKNIFKKHKSILPEIEEEESERKKRLVRRVVKKRVRRRVAKPKIKKIVIKEASEDHSSNGGDSYQLVAVRNQSSLQNKIEEEYHSRTRLETRRDREGRRNSRKAQNDYLGPSRGQETSRDRFNNRPSIIEEEKSGDEDQDSLLAFDGRQTNLNTGRGLGFNESSQRVDRNKFDPKGTLMKRDRTQEEEDEFPKRINLLSYKIKPEDDNHHHKSPEIDRILSNRHQERLRSGGGLSSLNSFPYSMASENFSQTNLEYKNSPNLVESKKYLPKLSNDSRRASQNSRKIKSRRSYSPPKGTNLASYRVRSQQQMRHQSGFFPKRKTKTKELPFPQKKKRYLRVQPLFELFKPEALQSPSKSKNNNNQNMEPESSRRSVNLARYDRKKYFKKWDQNLKDPKRSIMLKSRFRSLPWVLVFIIVFLVNYFQRGNISSSVLYMNRVIKGSSQFKTSIAMLLERVFVIKGFEDNNAKLDWFNFTYLSTENHGSGGVYFKTEDDIKRKFLYGISKRELPLAFDQIADLAIAENENLVQNFLNLLDKMNLQNRSSDPYQRLEEQFLALANKSEGDINTELFNYLPFYKTSFNSILAILVKLKKEWTKMNEPGVTELPNFQNFIAWVDGEPISHLMAEIDAINQRITELGSVFESNIFSQGSYKYTKYLPFLMFFSALSMFTYNLLAVIFFSTDIYKGYNSLYKNEIKFQIECLGSHLANTSQYEELSVFMSQKIFLKLNEYSHNQIVKMGGGSYGFQASKENRNTHLSETLSLLKIEKIHDEKSVFLLGMKYVFVLLGLFFFSIIVIVYAYAERMASVDLEFHYTSSSLREFTALSSELDLARMISTYSFFHGGREAVVSGSKVDDILKHVISIIEKNMLDLQKFMVIKNPGLAASQELLNANLCNVTSLKKYYEGKFNCSTYFGGILTKGVIFTSSHSLDLYRLIRSHIDSEMVNSTEMLKKSLFSETFIYSEFLVHYSREINKDMRTRIEMQLENSFEITLISDFILMVAFIVIVLVIEFFLMVKIREDFQRVYQMFRVIFPIIYYSNNGLRNKVKKYFFFK